MTGLALLLFAAGVWSWLMYGPAPQGTALGRIMRVAGDASQILFPLFMLAYVIDFYRRRRP
jgi:hypothetical protein